MKGHERHYENTDKEIWRRVPDDYYSPSIHVTESGSIGINVGGTVIVAAVEEWFAAKTRAALFTAEIAKQLRRFAGRLPTALVALDYQMLAFADRIEMEGKLAAIESVAGMLTAGEAAMIEAEPTTPTLAESRPPYEGVFPQPEIERGRVKGPEVPYDEGIVSRDNPRLRDLLTPEYATYLLDRICDGQSSPPWSDCMKGGCDQCDGPGTENCHPFCDALQKLAEKGK